MNKDFKEIFSSQVISIVGGAVAGIALSVFTNRLEVVPGLLVLLPGFLGMRGNISGSLSARLGSAMHLGKLKPKLKNTKILRENILATLVLAIVVSTFLGLIAYAFTRFAFGIDFPKIILVSVLAGLISNFIQMPLTVLASFYLYSRGHDPDNIMGPYITTLGDIVSVASLLAVILVIA